MSGLTEKEQQLLGQAMHCMKTKPEIDFEKLAALMKHTNSASTRNAWARVCKKLNIDGSSPQPTNEQTTPSAKGPAESKRKGKAAANSTAEAGNESEGEAATAANTKKTTKPRATAASKKRKSAATVKEESDSESELSSVMPEVETPSDESPTGKKTTKGKTNGKQPPKKKSKTTKATEEADDDNLDADEDELSSPSAKRTTTRKAAPATAKGPKRSVKFPNLKAPAAVKTEEEEEGTTSPRTPPADSQAAEDTHNADNHEAVKAEDEDVPIDAHEVPSAAAAVGEDTIVVATKA